MKGLTLAVHYNCVAQTVKNLPAMFYPWVRKIPWRRGSCQLQHSCLESSVKRGAWWATVHGAAKCQA